MPSISQSERTVQIAVAMLRQEGGYEAAADLEKLNNPDRIKLARAIVENRPTKGQGYLEIINLPPLERR